MEALILPMLRLLFVAVLMVKRVDAQLPPQLKMLRPTFQVELVTLYWLGMGEQIV